MDRFEKIRLKQQKERWIIRHPGKQEYVYVGSFDEAMEKWFEGFNPPRKLIDGKPEEFKKSCDRVRRSFDRN